MLTDDPFPYFDHLAQGQLGEIFGVSSHQIGRWLIELGVRVRKEPTLEAISVGLAKEVCNGDVRFFAWEKERTVILLEKAGHQRRGTKSTSIPPIKSQENRRQSEPIWYRQNGEEGDGFEIVDSGTVSIWVRGEVKAIKLVKLLNLARKHGKF